MFNASIKDCISRIGVLFPGTTAMRRTMAWEKNPVTDFPNGSEVWTGKVHRNHPSIDRVSHLPGKNSNTSPVFLHIFSGIQHCKGDLAATFPISKNSTFCHDSLPILPGKRALSVDSQKEPTVTNIEHRPSLTQYPANEK